jgi:hypothetical protein
MGGSCGREKSLPVLARYANLHESARPIGVGRAENINRLARSITMKRTPKGASAPIAKLQRSASVTPIHKLTTVPNPVYQDVVDQLHEMLRQAEAGELIGFAIAVMYSGRDYEVDAFGEAHRSPTFARGMVRALDDYLSEEVYQ